MNYESVDYVESVDATETPPTSYEVDILLAQGGVAVAVNLSLAFVLWALAKLVVACKSVA